MKSVSIFKHKAALSSEDADKLRESLKAQFADGLVLLDARLSYLDTLVLPEAPAAVGIMPEPAEATSGSPFALVRRSRMEASLEEIYPHLPPELRAVIEPRPLVETIDGERVEYADPLWIPSGTDAFGPLEGWYAEETDSVQLEIFKTERGRVKERNGETVFWWLRSPRRSYATYFVFVRTDGTVNNTNAYNSLAFAPGFDM